VEVVSPTAGTWEWTIKAFTMEQKMPVLNVAAPMAVSAGAPVAQAEPVEASSVTVSWIVRVLAFGIGAIAAVVAYRRRSALAIALTVVGLVAGVGSFWTGTAVPAVEAERASVPEAVSATSISQVELGRQLFVAKGCITCHVNSKVPDSNEYWTINADGATDLSNFSASPEILRIRLHDPTEAKSDTQMPNLGLSGDEIEALIAFINSD
jgi:cytochrome c2